MDSKLFQKKRRKIFKKTIKLAYEDRLKDKIDSLPDQFVSDKNDKRELESVKNEILTVLGLNPTAKYDTELSSEVTAAMNLDQIEEPLVTVNKSLCQECNQKNKENECDNLCIYDDNEKGLLIDEGRCISCGKCIPNCPMEAVSDKIEFIPMVKYLKRDIPVYANVAPAIVGQFGDNVTPGMLRTALKSIGFTDMVEVALFADIISIHEANEFVEMVNNKEDYLITSCCCPVWMNLLTKHYPELNERLTKIVSPMIASGRVIKMIFPEAITVFIGPCIAKKAEAKHPELKGAIDYVLTFSELKDIFEALNINLNNMKDDSKEQASNGGRIYGRTGGVSRAVEMTLDEIKTENKIKFKAKQADGIKECKKLLDKLITDNKLNANFIEGMGCKGGCVGGPKRNIHINKGIKEINEFGTQSRYENPIQNKNVAYILKRLSVINQKQRRKIPKKINFDKILLRE